MIGKSVPRERPRAFWSVRAHTLPAVFVSPITFITIGSRQ